MSKKKWSVSEKTLDKLWSKVIAEIAGYRCRLCGEPGGQAHHIVKRRHRVLRWDVENGLFLCPSCHRMAEDTPWWLIEAAYWIDYAYLQRMKMPLPEYCQIMGITRDEFRQKMKQKLKENLYDKE